MAEASLAADQSGLSDLSVASIGPYLDQNSPALDDQTDIHTSTISMVPMMTPRPAYTSNVDTPMPATSRTSHSASFDATPGPSRARNAQSSASGPTWTPSPDASNSRSRSRSMRRSTSPHSIRDANESTGSSLGTFDYSNASFSESFLRRAGADMLAGLDEAELPAAASSSSSPRYRNSSSPTITARPLRAPQDPRTPFTGKSLRTRMAEAGIMDSPTSSDGSSPSQSPSARMVRDNSSSPWSNSRSYDEEGKVFGNSPDPQRDVDSPMRGNGSPYQHGKIWTVEMMHDGTELGAEVVEESGWQEGLSMVPEESYLEDASPTPSSPAALKNAQSSTEIPVSTARPNSADQSSRVAVDPSTPLNQSGEPAQALPSTSAQSPVEYEERPTWPQPEASSPARSTVAPASPVASPQLSTPPAASTPSRSLAPSPTSSARQIAQRTSHTPRSFARLINTPARSSPLSRVTNFTPSSTGSSSHWTSPASQSNIGATAAPSDRWQSPQSTRIVTASPNVGFETPASLENVVNASASPALAEAAGTFQTPAKTDATQYVPSSPALTEVSAAFQTPGKYRNLASSAASPAVSDAATDFQTPARSEASQSAAYSPAVREAPNGFRSQMPSEGRQSAAPSPARSTASTAFETPARTDSVSSATYSPAFTDATAAFQTPARLTAPESAASSPALYDTPAAFVTPARPGTEQSAVRSRAPTGFQTPAARTDVSLSTASSPVLADASAGFRSPAGLQDVHSSTASAASVGTKQDGLPSQADGTSFDAEPAAKFEQEAEHSLQPHTPTGDADAVAAVTTPSRFWSPAMSANSYETPAGERQRAIAPKLDSLVHLRRDPTETAKPSRLPDTFTTTGSQRFVSAPATPASVESHVQTPVDKISTTPESQHTTPEKPAHASHTPSWSPFKAQNSSGDKSTPHEAPEEPSPRSASSCSSSSSSAKKQSGEVSTASLASRVSSQHKLEAKKADLSVSLVDASPSAARFSRLQLTRASPSVSSLGPALADAPELAHISSAFTSLTSLADSRVARLLAQLRSSTAHVEELEAALEASHSESDALRATLSKLAVDHESFVAESEVREQATKDLLEGLREKLKARSARQDGMDETQMLRRELEEERRMRALERRDFEVRLAGMHSPPTASSLIPPSPVEADEGAAVEEAKEQLRQTLEKDFQVRKAMEQRDLRARIAELEGQVASSLVSSVSNSTVAPVAEEERTEELERRLGEMEAELDRRCEELSDLREELEAEVAAKEAAEERVERLQEELEEVRETAPPDSRNDSARDEAHEEEVQELQRQLTEKQECLSKSEEMLSLAQARLVALSSEHATSTAALQERSATLENHVVSLEAQLRTRPTTRHAAKCCAPHSPSAQPGTPGAERDDRVAKLERELASLNLELVKLGKANEALQEDNVHFSIALSAKQLELGMVKRNARFALKNAQANANTSMRIGLPLSKKISEDEKERKEGKGEVKFPQVPRGEIEDKENIKHPVVAEVKVNSARANARALLAQRRAMGQGSNAGARGQEQQHPRTALLA